MPHNLMKVGLPTGLVADAGVTTAAFVAFTEGPAVDAEGNVYFSDIVNNRIMKRTADGALSVWRADSGRANGNMFDAQGRLVTCEGAEFGDGGRRRITRTDMRTGEVEVLTDRYEGKRYNSPNDLVIDNRGRTYFTDPRYKEDRSDLEMDVEAVYRLDPDGRVTRLLQQPTVQKPNGIAIAPDNRTLYVVDSNPAAGGNRKIWAFDLSTDGLPANRRLVYDFAPGRGGDGMRTDVDGNLWIAAGVSRARHANETADVPPGVYVVTPQGNLLGRIPVPEDSITNVAFGGPDLKTLYIVAGKSLFSIRANVAGNVVYPPPAR
jgi:gluconolactonase